MQSSFFDKLKQAIHPYLKIAKSMGYLSEDEMWDETFPIFSEESFGYTYATKLPDGRWMVWNDMQKEHQETITFEQWEYTIHYLRKLFIEKGLSENRWAPQGYDESDDVFQNPPCKEKR